jgi:hypothetical protein
MSVPWLTATYYTADDTAATGPFAAFGTFLTITSVSNYFEKVSARHLLNHIND